MNIYIDTSALIAILAEDDKYHRLAKEIWIELLEQKASLVCNNYTLLETFSLIQNRYGIHILSKFQNLAVPALHIRWLTVEEHNIAVENVLHTNRRHLSLVDCSSFASMRRLGIHKAFTFDKHFAEQGFECLPDF
ncbi:MAG: VapC toxin family PIN domain ribonuclease [Chloroflexota bacterium]|nr:MAG: hypothetical protein B6243_00415 [Anaerolineaceae bacterium 4572_5.2]RLD09767.1 MAG: VapC toxin family PIN domain ribonuclease [Chloroflexota bacterium]